MRSHYGLPPITESLRQRTLVRVVTSHAAKIRTASQLQGSTIEVIKRFCKFSLLQPRLCPTSISLLPQSERPPLWSSGHSSWLQIQRSGFDSWHYETFSEVVRPSRGPLSLVCTTEELLERNNSGSGLKIREYGRRGSAALTT
jgi:hypothetical protein